MSLSTKGIGIVVLLSCIFGCLLCHNQHIVKENTETYVSHNGDRNKRALEYVSKVLVKVMNGAVRKNNMRSPYMRLFDKTGDFKTAKKDFYSFHPRHVRTPTGEQYKDQGEVLFGTVNNLRLRLIEKGTPTTGRPTLEIINTSKKASKRPVDKLIYKEKDPDDFYY